MPTFIDYADQDPIGLKAALGARPHGLRLGLVPNGRRVSDAAMSSSVNPTKVTTVTGGFKASHIGRMAVVPGAGAAGSVLISAIVSVIDFNNAILAHACLTTVTGAVFAWGTDNGQALDAAIASVSAGGNALYLDGGLYLTSLTHQLAGNFKLYGPCVRIDLPHTQQQMGRYACILSTANPVLEVEPYAGVSIEDVHIHGLGTNTAIDLWDKAPYTKQVGIWLGNITKPLLETPTDDYGVGGSGGAFLNRVSISECGGWALYAYKFWGQSRIKDLQIYRCGVVPGGGDKNHYGGIALAGECADLNFDGVRIIAEPVGGATYMGTAIKLGGAGAELDALSRFKIGPTHTKFSKVFVEGQGKTMVKDYVCFATSWSQCFFGGAFERIEIGEVPTVSWLNNESVWTACGSFNLPHVYVRSRRVTIRDWMGEGTTVPKFHYNYPCIRITGTNIELVPETDDGAQSGYPNRVWESMPVAITDGMAVPYNLLPDYQSEDWTLGAAPEVFAYDSNRIRIYGGGIATVAITGLTPSKIHTFAMRHNVAFDSALENSHYRIYETAGADIVNLQLGSSDTALADTVTWILLQFVAPASGNVSIEFKNTDANQTEFIAPFLGYGALHEVYTGGYLIQADPKTNTIVGLSVRQTGDTSIWGDILARKASGTHAAILGNAPGTRVGLGMNLRSNGVDWGLDSDGTYNGGAAVLGDTQTGKVEVYVVPTAGTDIRKLTPSELAEFLRMVVTDSYLKSEGIPSTESGIMIEKIGAPAAANVSYRLSHRPKNKDFILYATDGTTTWQVLEAQFDAQKVFIDGVEIVPPVLLPDGTGHAGQFLQALGGTAVEWDKVDVGDSVMVKFTGGVTGKPVKKGSGGELYTEAISIADVNQATVPYSDGVVLAAAGGTVSFYTLAGLASNIQGLIDYHSIPGLDAVFAALVTAINGKSDLGHTHTTTIASGGTPSHTHGATTT